MSANYRRLGPVSITWMILAPAAVCLVSGETASTLPLARRASQDGCGPAGEIPTDASFVGSIRCPRGDARGKG